jgi:hypothetical protein
MMTTKWRHIFSIFLFGIASYAATASAAPAVPMLRIARGLLNQGKTLRNVNINNPFAELLAPEKMLGEVKPLSIHLDLRDSLLSLVQAYNAARKTEFFSHLRNGRVVQAQLRDFIRESTEARGQLPIEQLVSRNESVKGRMGQVNEAYVTKFFRLSGRTPESARVFASSGPTKPAPIIDSSAPWFNSSQTGAVRPGF